MASAKMSRRVEKAVGYPPLSDMGDLRRREFHEALLDADSFEDLPGKWQAAIVRAEQSRPDLRLVSSDYCIGCPCGLSPARGLAHVRLDMG